MTTPRLLNGRYELQEPIGRGGMAVIYRGRDQMLERTVAVKLLREDYSRDPVFQERFRQEARAAANLSHPNIVTVHDFGLDQGQLYIVMEFVPGTNLKELIRSHGAFTTEDALPLIIQACAGVGYAHRAGLVHCDVKPQNMLVMPEMRLKVADFGIARALATIRPDEHAEVVWGSPQYYSPEQAAGAAPSPASDVYSLGLVLYELLAGKPLYEGKSTSDLARQHLQERRPDLHAGIPQLSESLEQVLNKVLAREPARRYRTADQLGRVLSSLIPVEQVQTLSLTPEAAVTTRGKVRTLPAEVKAPAKEEEAPSTPATEPIPPDPIRSIDWAGVGLGILAVTMVLGLIPFWVWVYFVYNPPIR